MTHPSSPPTPSSSPSQPLYTPANAHVASRLYWSVDLFWNQFSDESYWFSTLREQVCQHGITLFKHRRNQADSQLFLGSPPHLAPDQIVKFLKGNLQTIVRPRCSQALRRHYGFRSLGSSKQAVIDRYIGQQVAHHPMADPRVEALLAELQIENNEVDLLAPRRGAHTRYWYNFHLVIVNQARWRQVNPVALQAIRQGIIKICEKRGYQLARAGILPDHFHLMLGCPHHQSPQTIALCFMNNLAWMLDMKPIFQYGFFVGTFGAYDLGVMAFDQESGPETTSAPPT